MDRTKALTWTELRVGLVVIVSLIVLAFTILYIGSGGGSPLSSKYEVRALMSDVNGLKPGAPVRVGGVEVGTVTHVDFSQGGGVEVAMRLDGRVKERVTTESKATLGALGLLGEKAVDISSAAHGQPIQPGGYVPSATDDPFKGLLSDASDSIGHMRKILARMDAGEGLIGKALRDDDLYNRMTDVAVKLQSVANKLESADGPLGRLVNDRVLADRLSHSTTALDAAMARVEAGEGPLGALSRDQQMADHIKELAANMAQIAERLESGQGSAGKLLKDDALATRLDRVSERMDHLLERLEKGEGSAGRLVQDPEMYENLNGAAREMRSLVTDIRKDPRKYLRVKLSLF